MDATWWAVFFAVTVVAFAIVAWLDGRGTEATSPPRTSPLPIPRVAAESVPTDTSDDDTSDDDTSDDDNADDDTADDDPTDSVADEVSPGNRRPKGLDT
jgi:hypothetical protein